MEMNCALVTGSFRPGNCGVSDYCLNFANELKARGYSVDIIEIAHTSKSSYSHRMRVISNNPMESEEVFGGKKYDFIIVQYTPFLFSKGWLDHRFRIVHFLKNNFDKTKIFSIFHEVYFFQKLNLKSIILGVTHFIEIFILANLSDLNFSSSQVFLKQARWLFPRQKFRWLPISSNLSDDVVAKNSYSINLDSEALPTITIFGGGNNLRWIFSDVIKLQEHLIMCGIAFQWKVLGAVDADLVQQLYRPKVFKNLSESGLSKEIWTTDIFLMPNWSGICLKRSTLMSAMQHEKVVIGTLGRMTDEFVLQCDGVVTYDRGDIRELLDNVSELCLNPEKRKSLGSQNGAVYRKHLSAKRRTDLFLSYIEEVLYGSS